MPKVLTLISLCLLCGVLAACGSDENATEIPTLASTRTPTAVATLTNTPSPTPQPTATDLPPPTQAIADAEQTEEADFSVELVPGDLDSLVPMRPPPLNITLPEGWQSFDTTQPITEIDGTLEVIPLTVYFGPVTGGIGQIIVMWAFPSFSPSNAPNSLEENLYFDGLRLLRFALFDANCNIGTDVERTYFIGEQRAQGTLYSAVDCPDGTPDIRGWFAGVVDSGINYMFFMGAEPITAMDGTAPQEIQAILDTIEFTGETFNAP